MFDRALKLVLPSFLAKGKEGEVTFCVLKCRCCGGSEHLQGTGPRQRSGPGLGLVARA